MPDDDIDPTIPPGQDTFDRKYVQELRNEAIGYRTRLRAAETKLQESGNAVAELAVLKAETRDLKITAALTETATRLGADPKLTKAVLHTDGHLATLNPDGADFAAAMEALISTAMENTPQLKGQAPPSGAVRSGSDGMSTNRAPHVEQRQPISRADLQDMKPEAIASMYAKGELNHILGRTR